MNKEKGLIAIIVIIVSVVLTVFIAMWLLDTTGKVNQGNYRISDIIIQSGATVTEVQDNSVKIEKLSGLFFDVSQTNEVTIFVEANTKIASMMLDNIKISDPGLKGKISNGNYRQMERKFRQIQHVCFSEGKMHFNNAKNFKISE